MEHANNLLIPILSEINEIASFKFISDLKQVLSTRLQVINKTMISIINEKELN